MKQIRHPSGFLQWIQSMAVKSCETEKYELEPISKQKNERQVLSSQDKQRKEWAPFN